MPGYFHKSANAACEPVSSVMIAGLQKIDALISYKIDNSVLLGQPARPNARTKMFEWFRFPIPSKGFLKISSTRLKARRACFAVNLHPVPQIFAELLLKDRCAFPILQRQDRLPFAGFPAFVA